MVNVRLGTTINFEWFVKNNLEAPLEEQDVRLVLINPLKKQVKISYTIVGDTFVGTFEGRDQKNCGKYRFLCVINPCKEDQIVFDYCNAFILMEPMKNNQVSSGENGEGVHDVKIKLQTDLSLGNIVSIEDIENIVDNYLSNTELSNYVTKEELYDEDYASKTYVTQQLANYITQGNLDLSDYITKNELESYNFATKSEIPDISDLASESYVLDKISNFATKSEVDDKVSNTYLHSYYYDKEKIQQIITEEIEYNFSEEDSYFKASPAYTITQENISNWNDTYNTSKTLVSYAYLSSKNYLTEHQSLNDYATKSYVNEKTEPLATKTYLGDNYYNKTETKNNFVSYSYLRDKNYLTEHQDLSSYATKSYVNEKTEPLASKSYVMEKVSGMIITEQDPVFCGSPAYNITQDNISVINHLQYVNAFNKLAFDSNNDSNDGFIATENYVLDQLSQQDNLVIKLTQEQYDFLAQNNLVDDKKIYMITDGESDTVTQNEMSYYATKTYVGNTLSGYYTKQEVDNMIANVSSGGVIDLSGYATENFVRQYISGLNYATKSELNDKAEETLQLAKEYADSIEADGIDLTDYATKAYVNNRLQNYALQSDIPETNSFATRSWVNNNFQPIGDIDLSAYATKSYVNEKIQEAAISGADIDLSSYVTYTYLESKNYLTQHQSLSDYATKSYVMDKVNNTSDYLVWSGTETQYNALQDKTQYKIYLIKQ